MRRLGNLKIGDKFFKDDRLYLIIDLDLPTISLTTIYPKMTCALDLNTYQIVCFNPEFDVKFEQNGVLI